MSFRSIYLLCFFLVVGYTADAQYRIPQDRTAPKALLILQFATESNLLQNRSNLPSAEYYRPSGYYEWNWLMEINTQFFYCEIYVQNPADFTMSLPDPEKYRRVFGNDAASRTIAFNEEMTRLAYRLRGLAAYHAIETQTGLAGIPGGQR